MPGAVVGFRPDDESGVCAHQARGYSQSAAGLADASVEDIRDAELIGDIGERKVLVFEVKSGRGRRYTQARNLTELIDQFFGHAVGEFALFHAFCEIEKGQHCYGFLRGGNR